MKRYIVALFVAILALASCAKDLDDGRINDDNAIDGAKTVLTFTSERPQLDPSTKTAWDADFHGIVWSAGDKIKIGFTFDGNWWSQTAAYDGTGHKKFYTSNEVVIDSENHNIGTFTVPMGANAFTGPTTSGDFVFYSFYPNTSSETNNQDGAPYISINLNDYQIPAADSFDPATDILVGKSHTITSTGLPSETINLYWTRVVAHGNFTLKNFQDVVGFNSSETIAKVVFTAQEGANLTGSQSISVVDGSFTGIETSNTVTLEGTNLSFVTENGSTNLNVWLSVMPVNLTSLEVDVYTNKAKYHRSFPSINNGGRELLGNRRNTMNINMASAERTEHDEYYWVRRSLSAITPNDVFVIVGNNGSNYAMSNNNSDADPQAVGVTVTPSGDRLSTVNPAQTIQWKLDKDNNGYYTFYPVTSTSKYLYCYNNNTRVLRVGTTNNSNYHLFYLSEYGYLKNVGISRELGIYNNTWRCYSRKNNGTISNINGQTFAFYVRVDAASYRAYVETFSSTISPNTTDYSHSFVCDDLNITLANINNSNRPIMSAGGSNSDPRVASITTNDAFHEAIKTVTLSITTADMAKVNSIKLLVSSTSDFESPTTIDFKYTGVGDATATILEPAANMYYKIEIDIDGSRSRVGNFQFNRIIYATE